MEQLESELEKWRGKEDWVTVMDGEIVIAEGQSFGEKNGYLLLRNPFLPTNTFWKFEEQKTLVFPSVMMMHERN